MSLSSQVVTFTEGDRLRLTFPSDQQDKVDRLALTETDVLDLVLPEGWTAEWLDEEDS